MRRAWVRELLGWVTALGASLVIAAQVAASARSELLFRDGDSLIVAMFARSALSGEHLDWAMSSVLFLPESAVFAALSSITHADLNTLLAVNAVVNLLAIYGAVRLAAGARRAGTSPVAWSLIALSVFGAMACTETSPSRDALELASLQLTTTYYSSTVVAVLVVIGLLRRSLDGPGSWSLAVISPVAVVATLSNPLFAAWATVPLTLLLAIGAARPGLRRRMLLAIGILIASTVVGFLARIPFAAWIANTGAGYAQPERWRESIAYYGELLAERLTTPLGVLGALLVLALVALAVVRTVRATSAGERLVAAAGWMLPVIVAVGAIALGTHAARYLEPVVFAPLLALVAAPRTVRMPQPVGLIAIVLVVIAGVSSVPRLSAAAHAPDADLRCVTDWVNASGRTGGGQFWTVRLPKAHLGDPSQLVQVDHRLNGYAWLVNRTDFDHGSVSFLVEDSQTVQWELPASAVPERIVQCGRYSILDYGSGSLPVGPAHS